jgi:thermitase
VSALWQQRHVRTDSRKQNVLVNVRSDDDHDITIGGMLFDTSYDIDDPNLNLSLELTHDLQDVTDSFQQVLSSASQLVETERSLVVSNFEESESVNTTARSIRNPNPCYAVTYFVRRVMEVYELRTRIKEISIRRPNMRETAFRPVSDLAALPGEARTHLRGLPPELFRAGIVLQSPIRITIPTDGALYEAELAHCSSCDPARQAEVDLGLERARCELRRLCLEGDLMELEVQRRRALIDRGELGSFLTTVAQAQVAWTPAERAPAVEVTATTPRLVT